MAPGARMNSRRECTCRRRALECLGGEQAAEATASNCDLRSARTGSHYTTLGKVLGRHILYRLCSGSGSWGTWRKQSHMR